MPLYEYFCEPCDGVFEELRTMREAGEPAPCPECNREAMRIMPTTFMAFTMREGYPRRIPDTGKYWHRGKEVRARPKGVRANEHQELLKPREKPRVTRGDKTVRKEARMEERRKIRELKRELSPKERRQLKGRVKGM